MRLARGDDNGMRRHLLNLLTALSLLLCAATVALWVRSYAPRDLTIGSEDGKLLLLFTDGQWTGIVRTKESYTVPYSDVRALARSQATGTGSWLGVSYFAKTGLASPRGTPGRFLIVAVPLAYPALLSAAAATASLLTLARRRARGRQGQCRKCGYDLTGNLSGKCPECGTPVTTPA
jgi:hypothetical protein